MPDSPKSLTSAFLCLGFCTLWYLFVLRITSLHYTLHVLYHKLLERNKLSLLSVKLSHPDNVCSSQLLVSPGLLLPLWGIA